MFILNILVDIGNKEAYLCYIFSCKEVNKGCIIALSADFDFRGKR